MTGEPQTNLPNGWKLADLCEVAEVNPRLDKSAHTGNPTVSFVPMPGVEAGTGAIDVSQTRSFEEVKKGYTPFREGDVLFAKITPCMENGKMAVVPPLKNGLGFGSTEFHVLRPYGEISAQYIYFFISSESFRRDAEHNMTGAVGQRRVPTSYLADKSVPVPPALEQRRIVAKIKELFSELDKGIESLKTAQAQLKVYRQAVLKHAFEGKLTAQWREENSATPWTQTTLGSQLSFLTSGSRGWAKFYAEHGDKFIRAQNLKHDWLDLADMAFVDLPDKSEGMRTRVQIGDLLITITGANVTKTAFVTSDIGTAYVSQHVALARPVEGSNTEFLYWYLVSESAGRKQLTASAYGAGKPGLNLENIRSVKIPLPSAEEQTEIVSRINTILSSERNISAQIDIQLARSEALRQSILKKAFSGQLVPQDLHDEPASVLLDRIRAERKKAVKNNHARKTKKRKTVA